MNDKKLLVPRGAYDTLPGDCKKSAAVEAQVRRVFEDAQYCEIRTPAFEYYDVFTHEAVPYVQESMIKFFDKSGRILVLRPEMTVPIARVAATKLLGEGGVLRLYYMQNVYGYQDADLSAQAEENQAGAELIGVAGVEGDAEILSLAVRSLLAAGVAHFTLEVGHVGLFTGLMRGLGLSPREQETLRALIDAKNTVELEYQLGKLKLADDVRKSLLALPALQGGGEALQRAYALAAGNAACVAAVDNIKSIYERVLEMGLGEYIKLDFGLLNNYKYYSGMIVRGVASGVGSPVLSGGRYDELLGEFGRSAPATGFALRMKEVLAAGASQCAEKQAEGLTIALAKGRLAAQGAALLERCGLDVSQVLEPGRRLVVEDARSNVKFLLVKPADVPVYVYHGVADLGIVGKDTLLEAGLPMYEVLDLRLGKCKISVAGVKGQARRGNILKVATKYPGIARRYYADMGVDVEIIKLNGSIELAPLLGLADVIVDIVESGATLRENGLSVLEDVCPVSARLVVNRVSKSTKAEKIDELVRGLTAALEEA